MTSQAGRSGVSVHASLSLAVSVTGNGSSTNGSSPNPQSPKKRPRRPEVWKRNVAKLKDKKARSTFHPQRVKPFSPAALGVHTPVRNALKSLALLRRCARVIQRPH